MKPKYNIGDIVYVKYYRFVGGQNICPNFHRMRIVSVQIEDDKIVYNWLYSEDECFNTPNELRDYLIAKINQRRDQDIKLINEEFSNYVKNVIKGGEE